MFGSYTILIDIFFLDGGILHYILVWFFSKFYTVTLHILHLQHCTKKNCKPGYFGALGTRCVASILVDGLSVLHLNWWNTRRYGLFGDWFKIKIRSTWEIRKCPELEMAVGCILARELMTTRRFKTGEDDASSFCTQGERREELIYSNFHVIL